MAGRPDDRTPLLWKQPIAEQIISSLDEIFADITYNVFQKLADRRDTPLDEGDHLLVVQAASNQGHSSKGIKSNLSSSLAQPSTSATIIQKLAKKRDAPSDKRDYLPNILVASNQGAPLKRIKPHPPSSLAQLPVPSTIISATSNQGAPPKSFKPHPPSSLAQPSALFTPAARN